VLALGLSASVLFPVFDRWQNLHALARQIHRDTTGRNLALLQPDETTIAMLDYRLRTPFAVLADRSVDDRQSVSSWFQQHGAQARVLMKLPGHAPGEVTQWASQWYRVKPAEDGLAATLETAGVARIVARYELPQGRRYALLGPPLAIGRDAGDPAL